VVLRIASCDKGAEMAYIRVIYRTKRNDFDYVSGDQLDTLIKNDEITHFYRPSEKRWINVRRGSIRTNEDQSQGPGRRRTDALIDRKIKKQLQKRGNGLNKKPEDQEEMARLESMASSRQGKGLLS